MTQRNRILACIDAPDPDNFVQLLALHKLNPGVDIDVLLTGRPVRFGAKKGEPIWDWDFESSRMVQNASAFRIKTFLQRFDITNIRIFDGGVAPRTLVPHWVHFADYYKFNDIDPLEAVRKASLEPVEELLKILLALPPGSLSVAVGGPMTGLHQLIVRCPDIASRFKEIHAMFATWGNVTLMEFGDEPRGATQFNVACDPQAAHAVLLGLKCPIYLMPTEVTRVKQIGFADMDAFEEALPATAAARKLRLLYHPWYFAAVEPRQGKEVGDELIYIHDLSAAFSLDEVLRKAIYDVVPIEIISVPHLPSESADWGKVLMKQTQCETNVFAAKKLNENGADKYIDALKKLFE